MTDTNKEFLAGIWDNPSDSEYAAYEEFRDCKQLALGQYPLKVLCN